MILLFFFLFLRDFFDFFFCLLQYSSAVFNQGHSLFVLLDALLQWYLSQLNLFHDCCQFLDSLLKTQFTYIIIFFLFRHNPFLCPFVPLSFAPLFLCSYTLKHLWLLCSFLLLYRLAFNQILLCQFCNHYIADFDIVSFFYQQSCLFICGYAVSAIENRFRIQRR